MGQFPSPERQVGDTFVLSRNPGESEPGFLLRDGEEMPRKLQRAERGCPPFEGDQLIIAAGLIGGSFGTGGLSGPFGATRRRQQPFHVKKQSAQGASRFEARNPDARHSTVTLLARLRGLSISLPS